MDNIDELEGGKAKIVDNFIIGTETAFSGQTGIVYIWDITEDKLVHISGSNFVLDATILNNEVYSLGLFHDSMHSSSFVLNKSKFGTMNATESEDVPFSVHFTADDYDGNLDHVSLFSKGNKLYLKLMNKECQVVLK